jgi:6-phosphogluconolactonase (cycloisomerase 2 family)
MKRPANITVLCGAAAVILSSFIMLYLMKNETTMEIIVGTYGEQIYRYGFDTERLEFSLMEKVKAENASYAIKEGDNIFAVSETGNVSGAYSFRVGEPTIMTADKRQTGADPCFIVKYDGKVLTADYSGGSVSVFPATDGALGDCTQKLEFQGCGPREGRQESSHIHQIKIIPQTGWILVSDLGADKIRLLRFENGTLVHKGDIDCPVGSGPRHMEFSKDAKTLYCICELSGNVLAYSVNATDIPDFTLIQEIQADEVNAGGSADIHLHPSGQYLYTSHRLNNDGISIFKTHKDGTLEKIGYARTGRHPRNFMITPGGKLLLVACMNDHLVQVFKIEDDGTLTLTPSVLRLENDRPSSLTLSEREE